MIYSVEHVAATAKAKPVWSWLRNE